MSDLGELLKKARTEKGMDLDQLQDTTKIQKRYLQAIEQENFKILPGNFYVRAFIKSYAEAVGLDPEEVLRLYRNVIPATVPETRTEPLRKKRKKALNTDRMSKWTSTVLLWLFLFLIIASIYVYLYYFRDQEPPVADDDTPITEQLQEQAAPQIDEPSGAEQLPDVIMPDETEDEPDPIPAITYVNTDGDTYIYTISNTDTLMVELKITGHSCWILVQEENKQGKKIEEGSFYKDDTLTWEVDHSMWIRLGNPGNTELRINDILIDLEKMSGSNPWNVQMNLVSET